MHPVNILFWIPLEWSIRVMMASKIFWTGSTEGISKAWEEAMDAIDT